ncbi:MAG: alpha/beta fold hydrolase [Rhodopila sp.]
MTASFREGFVEADGFRIRYWEAGAGPVLVHLHGAGGPRLERSHEMLAERHRVIVFEMPGFGASADNTRSGSMQELATIMERAIASLGVERCTLLGTSFGGKVSLWLAVLFPDRLDALILEGSGAIRPEGHHPPSGAPEEIARRLYAHPERVPPVPPLDPAVAAKQRALTGRLRGPDRDAALEERLPAMAVPTLVLFGTLDGVIPPEMGREYKRLLPDCHLLFVYDAGHEIGAERPEAFVEAVSDFTARKAAFVINQVPTQKFP